MIPVLCKNFRSAAQTVLEDMARTVFEKSENCPKLGGFLIFKKKKLRKALKNVNHRYLKTIFQFQKNTEFRTVFGFFKHSFGHIF